MQPNEVDSPEAFKRYLTEGLEGTRYVPTDSIIEGLYKLIEKEGANPYHLRFAFRAALCFTGDDDPGEAGSDEQTVERKPRLGYMEETSPIDPTTNVQPVIQEEPPTA